MSEIQSGSRDHISDQPGLSLTKPSTCAQSDRGILVILSVSIRAQRACDITSTYVAMVEDLTQGGRKPEHFIPARVSLPGMKRHGRGPSASSVDPRAGSASFISHLRERTAFARYPALIIKYIEQPSIPSTAPSLIAKPSVMSTKPQIEVYKGRIALTTRTNSALGLEEVCWSV